MCAHTCKHTHIHEYTHTHACTHTHAHTHARKTHSHLHHNNTAQASLARVVDQAQKVRLFWAHDVPGHFHSANATLERLLR